MGSGGEVRYLFSSSGSPTERFDRDGKRKLFCRERRRFGHFDMIELAFNDY
jgi:hypothetical protein